MSWFCQACGSPNHPTSPSCMTCGAQPPPGGGGAAQASYQAAQQYQQPGQQQWGAPQQGFGAPQPQFGAPQQARRKQSDGKGMLIGCGAAGCLGIVGIIVVLFLVIGSSGSSSGSSDDDDGKSRPSGRLKENVQKNVAGWKVKSTKPLEVSGSVDAIVVQYKKSGKLIEWAVAVFPSEERAQEHLLAVTRSVANDVSVQGDIVRIKDDKGNEIGLGSHFESNPEFLCYRIGKLMAVISGPRGDVVPFFRELP